jgi:hypothetical protein
MFILSETGKRPEGETKMPSISELTFPSFYTECAYRDGVRDQRNGSVASVASYMRHGEPEPLGMDWYQRGHLAAALGLIA